MLVKVILVKKAIILPLLFFLLFSTASAMQPAGEKKAIIYENEACGHCGMYIANLKKVLLEKGYSFEEKYIMSDLSVRQELAQLNASFNVPVQLQGHLAVKIGNVLLQGHVPVRIVRELFDAFPGGDFPKLIIYQDLMVPESELKSFSIMEADGKIKELPITASLEDSLEMQGKALSPVSLVSLVLATGLIDGINPCAFGVLLFFIAFLFAIKSTRAHMLKIGLAYISMIFLAYFLIGIGLMQAFASVGFPHLISKMGAVLVLIVGIFSIKDYFFPGGFSLKMPSFSEDLLKKWVYKATLSAALVLGFLVGLCTFPCSGGIYVAILSLLTAQTTYLEGLFYLVLYNIMFVLPLIIVLFLASNKKTLSKMESWEKTNKAKMKLVTGIIMLVLGIILWLVAM